MHKASFCFIIRARTAVWLLCIFNFLLPTTNRTLTYRTYTIALSVDAMQRCTACNLHCVISCTFSVSYFILLCPPTECWGCHLHGELWCRHMVDKAISSCPLNFCFSPSHRVWLLIIRTRMKLLAWRSDMLSWNLDGFFFFFCSCCVFK